MDPVTEFFKLAKTVHVKEYARKTPSGGTTVVDEHDRVDDDIILAGAETPIPDTTSVVDDEFDVADTALEPAGELAHKTKLRLESVDKQSFGRVAKGDELELWQKWKQGGRKPEDLEPLLHSFKPLLSSKINVYRGKVKLIPDSAIEAEFQLRFAEALNTYDPSKGQLSTYVYRYLDKAKRFIGDHQNIGRIPENRLYKIKHYQKMQNEIAEDTGRVPTQAELAKKLGWSVAEVGRLDAELRNDLTAQGFEDDPYAMTPSKSEEVLRLFKYELSGPELHVYEYLTGYGKPKLTSTGEIGKRVGIPDYQVSRYKESIQKKLRKHMEE